MAKRKFSPLVKKGFETEQVNSDWNTTNGKAQILNKPDLSIYSQNANLGNILFVSANAPIINNGQNRATALGRIDKPFKSIQSALNVCSSEDTIVVFAGTYTENLITVDKTIFLNFIGNCVLNGNIEKYNGNWGFSSFLSIIGEELTINGNITIQTNWTNTKNYIKVKKINSGNLIPLNSDFRTSLIIKDTEIVTNTNTNATDNAFNSYTNCKIKATGIFIFGGGVAANCEIECSRIYTRQDSGILPKLENCNVTTTDTNVIFMGDYTTINNYIILKNCRFIASCNYLGSYAGYRPFNVDAKYCDFSQCNFAIALFNLADVNYISNTQIYIDYCKFKKDVIFNQQGNNNMPSEQYYSFHYNIT